MKTALLFPLLLLLQPGNILLSTAGTPEGESKYTPIEFNLFDCSSIFGKTFGWSDSEKVLNFFPNLHPEVATQSPLQVAQTFPRFYENDTKFLGAFRFLCHCTCPQTLLYNNVRCVASLYLFALFCAQGFPSENV